MFHAKRQMGLLVMNRTLVISVMCILIVLIVVCVLFAKTVVKAMKSALTQDQKSVTMQYENNSQLPVAITEAYLQVGEPYNLKFKMPKAVADQSQPAIPDEALMRRDLTFTAKIVNQSAYPITQVRLAIENPAFLPKQIITIICRLSGAPERTANKNQPLKPNDLFVFSRKLPLEDRMDGKELIQHVSDFRVKVIGVSSSTEDDQLWLQSFLIEYDEGGMIVSQGLKDFSDTPRAQYLQALSGQLKAQGAEGPRVVRLMAGPAQFGRRAGAVQDFSATNPSIGVPEAGSDGRDAGGSVEPMSAALKPTILYKEKAKYTHTARTNKIQGTVVLNVVFAADGTINSIRVVRGLPDGLTEKAIEAARKTRFQPAVNNGVAVSVRGNIEFSFQLDN